jgi:AcrR family transcriptional regulator
MMVKRKTSKEILAEAFREVAAKKNIDRITVQDIVNNCGYSPATFYRNFSDKYDLIAWDHTRSVAEIMGRISDSYSWKQTLADGAN